MQTTRICLLLLAAFLCVPGVAQSNAHPDYSHQQKDAQKYQKSLLKQRHKQEKAQVKAAKAAKAARKHHHQ